MPNVVNVLKQEIDRLAAKAGRGQDCQGPEDGRRIPP